MSTKPGSSKESADFICASTTERRLVVIHAKHKDSVRSASALHDVCAQALKNLAVLQPFGDAKPVNYGRWSGNWTAAAWDEKKKKRVSIGKVPRLRRGTGGKAAVWKKMAQLRRHPDSSREVWLVLGKTLKLDWLRKQQRKSDPSPQAVQAFYLLESLWTSVSAIGARLRIFTAAQW